MKHFQSIYFLKINKSWRNGRVDELVNSWRNGLESHKMLFLIPFIFKFLAIFLFSIFSSWNSSIWFLPIKKVTNAGLKRSKLWYGLSKKDLRGCQSWKARLGKVMTRSFPEFEPRWDSFAFPFIPNQFRFKRKKMFGRKISFSDEREVFPSSWRLIQKFSFLTYSNFFAKNFE